jgi:hypothetical protein
VLNLALPAKYIMLLGDGGFANGANLKAVAQRQLDNPWSAGRLRERERRNTKCVHRREIRVVVRVEYFTLTIRGVSISFLTRTCPVSIHHHHIGVAIILEPAMLAVVDAKQLGTQQAPGSSSLVQVAPPFPGYSVRPLR